MDMDIGWERLDGKFTFYICLPVRNEWRNIDLLRTSVQNCFTAMFADLDNCNAIAMVTGELLENALKYGNWHADSAPQVFRLRAIGDTEIVEVSVQNPCNPDSSNIARLNETLRWIASRPSAETAYRERLLAIASAPDGAGEGGLGLVRIAYEGTCALEADVTEGVLTVTARMTLGKRKE
jgi:hypothetical protein